MNPSIWCRSGFLVATVIVAAVAPVTEASVPDDYPFKVAANATRRSAGLLAESAVQILNCGPMDVVFVVDDTGDMSGEIASLQAGFFVDIVPVLDAASGGDYRLGLVTFKDVVHVDLDLGVTNPTVFFVALSDLIAEGGGLAPEASDEALNTVIHGLDAADRPAGLQVGDFDGMFRPEANGLILLYTNSLPGGFDDAFTPGVDDVNAHSLALEASISHLKISAFTASNDPAVQAIMYDYATATGGVFYQGPSGAASFAGDAIAQCGGPRVFADGFESGNTSAWSATIP